MALATTSIKHRMATATISTLSRALSHSSTMKLRTQRKPSMPRTTLTSTQAQYKPTLETVFHQDIASGAIHALIKLSLFRTHSWLLRVCLPK